MTKNDDLKIPEGQIIAKWMGIGIAIFAGLGIPLSIITSNFAFMLPIGTPASAVAYSSRFISIAEMVRTGSLLSLLGVVAFATLLFFYWPLLGYH